MKDDITRNLDDVVCKLISLESGGAIADSILSVNSQNYSTAESEVDSEGEQQQQQQAFIPRKPSPHVSPVLSKSLQVGLKCIFRSRIACFDINIVKFGKV